MGPFACKDAVVYAEANLPGVGSGLKHRLYRGYQLEELRQKIGFHGAHNRSVIEVWLSAFVSGGPTDLVPRFAGGWRRTQLLLQPDTDDIDEIVEDVSVGFEPMGYRQPGEKSRRTVRLKLHRFLSSFGSFAKRRRPAAQKDPMLVANTTTT